MFESFGFVARFFGQLTPRGHFRHFAILDMATRQFQRPRAYGWPVLPNQEYRSLCRHRQNAYIVICPKKVVGLIGFIHRRCHDVEPRNRENNFVVCHLACEFRIISWIRSSAIFNAPGTSTILICFAAFEVYGFALDARKGITSLNSFVLLYEGMLIVSPWPSDSI
jgi:hypothetical protein